MMDINENGWKELIRRTADAVEDIRDKQTEITVGIAKLDSKMDLFVKKDDYNMFCTKIESQISNLSKKRDEDLVVDYKTILKDWRTYVTLGVAIAVGAFFVVGLIF